MLLNAANVVTAAERCKAIDEKTGMIPIDFLLSRSTDLDAGLKQQLEQMAVTSPGISILERSSLARSSSVAMCHDSDTSPKLEPVEPLVLQSSAFVRRASSETEVALSERTSNSSRDGLDGEYNDDREYHGESGEGSDYCVLDTPVDCHKRSPRRAHASRTPRGIYKQAVFRHSLHQRDTASTTASPSSVIANFQYTEPPAGEPKRFGSPQRTAKSSHRNTPRRRWTEMEDGLLVQVVDEHGPGRWNMLARDFPGRNGRQVRLRWMNHLHPNLDKRPWRSEEDDVLLEAHKALGNKWALISMRLVGRTDNSVKNRYKSIARRELREAKAVRQRR